MKEILRLNEISPLVNSVFADKYIMTKDAKEPVGILVRSFNMHEYNLAPSVLCVGRAGAGTNNIPLDRYADEGVVVFNTPGCKRKRGQGAGFVRYAHVRQAPCRRHCLDKRSLRRRENRCRAGRRRQKGFRRQRNQGQNLGYHGTGRNRSSGCRRGSRHGHEGACG